MSEQVACARCGGVNELPPGFDGPAIGCGHCGQVLQIMQPAFRPPLEELALQCPSCKAPMEPTAVLCVHCGYHTQKGKHLGPSLDDDDTIASPTHHGPTRKRGKKKKKSKEFSLTFSFNPLDIYNPLYLVLLAVLSALLLIARSPFSSLVVGLGMVTMALGTFAIMLFYLDDCDEGTALACIAILLTNAVRFIVKWRQIEGVKFPLLWVSLAVMTWMAYNVYRQRKTFPILYFMVSGGMAVVLGPMIFMVIAWNFTE